MTGRTVAFITFLVVSIPIWLLSALGARADGEPTTQPAASVYAASPIRDAGTSRLGVRKCKTAAPRTATQFAARVNRLPQGGDVALSVPLPSGDVAWIYADTHIPGVGMPHSTVIMQHKGCFTATRTQLLPDDRNGTFWWPIAATGLPDGDVLIVATDGYSGHVRAALAVEFAGRLRFRAWLPYWPQSKASGPTWFAGLLVDRKVLRVYGTRATGAKYVFGKELWVASVPLGGLRSGKGWRLGNAPIFQATPRGVDTVVAPYRDAAGYHLVTLMDGVLGDGPVGQLDGATASGPFTVRTLFRYNPRGRFRYSVAVHPEARLSKDHLLLTISNNWPWSDTALHPVRTYQPSYFAVRRNDRRADR